MRKPKGKAGKPATRVKKSSDKTQARNVLKKRNAQQVSSRRITRIRKGKEQSKAVMNKKSRQNRTSKRESEKNRIIKTEAHAVETNSLLLLDKGEAVVNLSRDIEAPSAGHRRSGRILALIDTNETQAGAPAQQQQPLLNIVSQAELEKKPILLKETSTEEANKETEADREEKTVSEDDVKPKPVPEIKDEVPEGPSDAPSEEVGEEPMETTETSTEQNVTPKEETEAVETTEDQKDSEASASAPPQSETSDDQTTPAKSKKDAATDSANPPATMPTPPSEDTSPKLGAQQQSPTSLSPPTPIKLKIKRNTGSGLTSTVTLGEEGRDGTSIEVQGQQGKQRSASTGSAKRQTRTKALLKGKRLSRRLSKSEKQQEDTAASAAAETKEKKPLVEPEPLEEALKSAIIDPSIEPTYAVGDMLWAKVGGHPYWSCMVSHDPYENLYYKQRKKKKVPTATLR